MFQVSHSWRWTLALCAVAVLAGCGGAKSRYLNHLQRGEHYMSAGQYDKANVEFRNALQIEPRDAQARYLIGLAAEKRGNVREAAGAYQAAIEVDPEQQKARAALGRILVLGGASQQALTIVEPGLAKHPDDAKLLTVRGAARAQLKDVKGATADAEAALKLAPNDADTVGLLASLYQQRGQATEAVDLVSAAVARQPADLALRQILAKVYIDAHQPQKGEEQFKKLIVLAPEELQYRYQLANYYSSTGNMDAAQQALQDAVAAFPASSPAKLVLADFLARQRSRAQGEQILRDYIAREPANDDLRLGLGLLLQRAGALPEAVTTYQQIVQRDPKSADALVARDRVAAINLAAGNVADAQRLIAEVLEQSPRDNDALQMRAEIALQRGDPTTAITDLRAVLRDQPSAVLAQRGLARAYLANHEPALAEETLRTAMQTSPSDAQVRLDLAQLLLRTQRADAAATLLEESIRQAPTDGVLRMALVSTYLTKRDLPAARTAAEDLTTLEPKMAAGPYLSGLVAQQQNRPDDAKQDFERALQLQPEALDALTALTGMQVQQGQFEAATTRLRAFVAAHPQNARAVNLLGEVLMASKSYPAAGEAFGRAIQLAPTWTIPYHNLALTRVTTQDIAGAEATLQAGIKAVPNAASLSAELAALYERQGRIDDAIHQYEAMYAQYPNLELAANNLAMLLVTYRTDQHSLDRARDLTAGFAGSDNGALLDTNGWVRLKLGDVPDAMRALERAAGRAPDSKVIHYHLAMAELKAGERAKARENLETALSGGAKFAGSDEAKATLDSLEGSRS
jgi:tetratricopeptide (TPR) repeat protein